MIAAIPCLTLAAPAPAQPKPADRTSAPSVALAWSGPGPELTCLGEEGLARAVNQYLGHDAFASGSAELVLGVTVERQTDRTWRARLEVRDASTAVLGSRVLVSSDELCSSLDEPLTLAVALMVDLEPEPEPAPAEAPALEQSEPSTPPRQPSADERWIASADAAVVAEAGLLPAPSVGLALGVDVNITTWLAGRLSGAGFLPAKAELPGAAYATLGLLYGELALCPQLELSPQWKLALCAGAALGTVYARSSGLEGGRSTERPVLGATLELRASVRLGGRWSAFWKFGGLVPARPERFVYELNAQRREFFRMAAFAPLAGIGGSVMF